MSVLEYKSPPEDLQLTAEEAEGIRLTQDATLPESALNDGALGRLVQALRAEVGKFGPSILAFAQNFEQVQRWVEEAPERLREALKDAGTIPHPELSLEDIRTVTAAFEEFGGEAAVDRIRVLHAELFDDENFRRGLAARWRASGRRAALEQILQAHDAGFYYLTIPAALAQAEGIVAEMFQHHGDMKMKVLEDYLLSLQESTDLYGPSVETFVMRFLFEKFRHGDPVPAFSRHAILHGADTSYGTKDKSLRSIVWVDYLLLCREERAALPSGVISGSS